MLSGMSEHPSGYLKGCQCERCAAYRQRSREYARTHPPKRATRPGQLPKTCQRCGAPFSGGGYKYCSDECRSKAHRKQKTGKQRDYNRNYTPEQKERRRALARERNKRRPGTRNSREWNLKHVHGLTPDQWHAMIAAQHGLCYLGGHPLPEDHRKIVVDHDHSHCGRNRSCGTCRRGLACSNCNTLIGLALDDPQLLRIIAGNLERQHAVTKALIAAAANQGQLDLVFT